MRRPEFIGAKAIKRKSLGKVAYRIYLYYI